MRTLLPRSPRQTEASPKLTEPGTLLGFIKRVLLTGVWCFSPTGKTWKVFTQQP